MLSSLNNLKGVGAAEGSFNCQSHGVDIERLQKSLNQHQVHISCGHSLKNKAG